MLSCWKFLLPKTKAIELISTGSGREPKMLLSSGRSGHSGEEACGDRFYYETSLKVSQITTKQKEV